MKPSSKLAVLDRIYAIYDQFAASLDLACKKYCSHCCTTSVTLTTIEGYKIIRALKSTTTRTSSGLDFTAIGGKRQGREVPQSLRVKPGAKHPVWKTQSSAKTDWIDKIQQASAQKHFRPKITINQIANMCAEDIEPPEEEPADGGACPFLSDNQCPIYAARPFACRCLVSRHDCGKEGYADMDDFVLSVNTVFLQTVEHMDANGCSGNMLDVLGIMAGAENRQAYEDNRLKYSSGRKEINPSPPGGLKSTLQQAAGNLPGKDSYLFDSLANPVASYGECARYCRFNF